MHDTDYHKTIGGQKVWQFGFKSGFYKYRQNFNLAANP